MSCNNQLCPYTKRFYLCVWYNCTIFTFQADTKQINHLKTNYIAFMYLRACTYVHGTLYLKITHTRTMLLLIVKLTLNKGLFTQFVNGVLNTP